jgi:hypothetical protein
MPGERSPWRGTLLNDATIGILDPYAVWREVPRSRLATERRDPDNRPVSPGYAVSRRADRPEAP